MNIFIFFVILISYKNVTSLFIKNILNMTEKCRTIEVASITMDPQKECSHQMNSNCFVNSHQFNENSVNLSQQSPKLLKSGNCTHNNETYKSNVNPSLTSNKIMFTTYCSTNAHVTSVVPIVASLASNSINSPSGLTNNLENTKSTTSFPGNNVNSCVNNTTNVNNSNPLTYILLPQNSYVPYCTLHRNNHNNSLLRPVMTPESSLACQLSPNITQHHTLTSVLITYQLAHRLEENLEPPITMMSQSIILQRQKKRIHYLQYINQKTTVDHQKEVHR
ncbi:unnamed protein product [Trichobilharzia szidati]|nr:unnamed protein product [Trichobilharzia szidati]